MKLKSGSLKKINKIDKTLATLIKKKRERVQINKIRNKKEVTVDTTKIQRVIKDYYKQLYINKKNILEEMDKLQERYNLPRPNQEKLETMKRSITSIEMETVIFKTKNISLDQMAS